MLIVRVETLRWERSLLLRDVMGRLERYTSLCLVCEQSGKTEPSSMHSVSQLLYASRTLTRKSGLYAFPDISG